MKLLDQVAVKLRFFHYSKNTEITYISWIRKYILYHHKKDPVKMGKIEIEQFLTHLVVDRKVAASTQNQAFNALPFLYNQVLDLSLESQNINALRAKQRIHLPVVLSPKEAR